MKLLVGLLILTLSTTAKATAADVFSVAPRLHPETPRHLILPQLVTFLLPSFDQWMEHQDAAAGIYAATALGGLTLAASVSSKLDHDDLEHQDLENYRNLERQYAYGLQLYMFAGELSAFHSFRTAVESRRSLGEFDFLKARETSADLLVAPFDFSEVLKPRVFTPLLVVMAISLGDPAHHFTWNDAAFTGGTSFNAGVGEESLFRGYMMPLLRQEWGSDFWSNTATATAFSLAHLSSQNHFPIVQGVLGWYLGWLTQSSGWSLKDAIFVHAWWDAIAIGFSIAQKDPHAVIPLPGVSFTF